MRCPFCGKEDTQVKDSRPLDDKMSIRRRRWCEHCNSRFTTFERVQLRELTVIKSSGGRRPFDREKLMRSVTMAVRKRPVSIEQTEQLVNQIVQKLETSGDAEIPTSLIGEIVMAGLQRLDKVAYIRFASVYRKFTEASDFGEFVESMKSDKKD